MLLQARVPAGSSAFPLVEGYIHRAGGIALHIEEQHRSAAGIGQLEDRAGIHPADARGRLRQIQLRSRSCGHVDQRRFARDGACYRDRSIVVAQRQADRRVNSLGAGCYQGQRGILEREIRLVNGVLRGVQNCRAS